MTWRENVEKAEAYILELLEEIKILKENPTVGNTEEIDYLNGIIQNLELNVSNLSTTNKQLNDQLTILDLKIKELNKRIEIEVNEKEHLLSVLQEK